MEAKYSGNFPTVSFVKHFLDHFRKGGDTINRFKGRKEQIPFEEYPTVAQALLDELGKPTVDPFNRVPKDSMNPNDHERIATGVWKINESGVEWIVTVNADWEHETAFIQVRGNRN